MSLDQNWFTEVGENTGIAFSLRINGKLHEERTEYQHIEIYDTTDFGHLMTIDGYIMLTQRDNFLYHEMLAHPVLYTHVNPKDVLIIGGGDCGTLKEALRHDAVKSAVQVEIDERVTRLSERFFPELCEANDDPRARLVFGDGIQWVADSEPESYDVIIIDSTDPIGPAEGLFSEPFYRDCFRALRPGGIIAQQSESPLLHLKLISAMRRAMRKAGFGELLTLNFPQCVYPSGWWSATLAGKGAALRNLRDQDIADKPFPTRYYNLAMHQACMAQPEFFRGGIEP
ncbi:MAG: polyamine aminopropyltransferase [Gammaproteobacteria bacterium]|nr:polyamine aminopropyltransferase [Gammaproteobacteria bacterium]